MDHAFDIADPRQDERGDYLNFTIRDGATLIPGRISGPAMRILASGSGHSASEVFSANKSKIRSAAYKSRRFNPTLAMIFLGTGDFS
ncbi:MAG TPA: hypothetical protein VFE79_08845 [Paraburkholderia sp.]|jgi:hypothetical protein|nr:hypothetical protein [Paraburkholderia sp.]